MSKVKTKLVNKDKPKPSTEPATTTATNETSETAVITAPTVEDIPSVFLLGKPSENIFKHDASPPFSTGTNYPLFSAGFHHFIHDNRNKMNEAVKRFEGKKKIYHVMNKYERDVDNYEQDLTHEIKGILGEAVTNRNFYKLWEILTILDSDVIGGGSGGVASTCFGDNADAYTQAIKLYRKKTNNKNDKYGVTSGATLIVADKNINPHNTQEQDMYKPLMTFILSAVATQANGGSFICKIYESFTKTSIKMLYILSSLYDNVYIVKPLMSRPSHAEKFVVCTGFNKKVDTTMMAALSKSNNLADIFPAFEIPWEYRVSITHANTQLADRQLVSINETVDFINAENYYGDVYHGRRKMQMTATGYWEDLFLKNKHDIKKKILDLIKTNTDNEHKLLGRVKRD